MFKLITQFTEQPTFLLLCDHHECGAYASAPVSLSALNPTTIPEQELQFLGSAKGGGWFVTMRIQFCPNHHKLLRDSVPAVTIPGQPAGNLNSVNPPTGGQAGGSFTAD